MNKILNIISGAVIALAAIACDPVSESERFIKADDLEVDRKVLVQEFTGQFCPNCPLGHEALDNIAKQFGENAVIVSIHAGEMAFDDPDFGLKNADGDKYAAEWNIQQYPSTVVNRKGVLVDRGIWMAAVFSVISKPSTVKINLDAEVIDGKISITSALSSTISDTNAKYQLWVVEDNINALQQDGEEYIEDYIHNHVYRASVNGIGGENVSVAMTAPLELHHSIAIDSHWNTANLKIVAFVYTSNDVLQAEEVKVTK